jgi:UDP-hydrolysing UDP-N-acetyl-D-glucosamine 2-epimerase
MKNIAIVITARPHYARLKSVLRSIQDHPDLNLFLFLGGSALLDRFGQLSEIVKKDGFEICEELYFTLEGDCPSNMVDSTALFAIRLSSILKQYAIDILFVHGDRYEQLAAAYTAAYMNITVIHNQGGELSGSIDNKVRNAISQLADYHFVSNNEALIRLSIMTQNIRSGIYNVGCPSIDICEYVSTLPFDIEYLNSLNEKYGGVGLKIDYSRNFIIVIFHPDTTESRFEINKQIRILANAVDITEQVLWLWPNVDAGTDEISGIIRRYRENGMLKNVRMVKNMEPEDFLRLMNICYCLVGNTSVGIREGSYLGTPYVCISDRQHDRDADQNTTFCKMDESEILNTIYIIGGQKFPRSFLYGDGTSGQRIAEIIATQLNLGR